MQGSPGGLQSLGLSCDGQTSASRQENHEGFDVTCRDCILCLTGLPWHSGCTKHKLCSPSGRKPLLFSLCCLPQARFGCLRQETRLGLLSEQRVTQGPVKPSLLSSRPSNMGKPLEKPG